MTDKNYPYIQSFIDYLKFEKRYSVHTIRSYQDDLVQFFDFLDTQFGKLTLKAISSSFVRSWLASLKDNEITARTINRKISTLKSFFKFQLKQGKIENTPMGNIISLTQPETPILSVMQPGIIPMARLLTRA